MEDLIRELVALADEKGDGRSALDLMIDWDGGILNDPEEDAFDLDLHNAVQAILVRHAGIADDHAVWDLAERVVEHMMTATDNFNE